MKCWIRNNDVELEKIDGKMLIFDPNLFNFYELNETMSSIWEMLKEPISEEQICSALTKEYDVHEKTACPDVKMAIDILKEKKLIHSIDSK